MFAKKASQSETKIENKYHLCTINIFKLLSSFSDQDTGIWFAFHITSFSLSLDTWGMLSYSEPNIF